MQIHEIVRSLKSIVASTPELAAALAVLVFGLGGLETALEGFRRKQAAPEEAGVKIGPATSGTQKQRAQRKNRQNPSEPVSNAQGCRDSGFRWESPRPPVVSLNAVWAAGPRDVFAVGDHGTIVHWDGSRWTVYFIRQPAKSGSAKHRWFLYTVDPDPGGRST